MGELLNGAKKVVKSIFGGDSGGAGGMLSSILPQAQDAPAPDAVKTLLTPTTMPSLTSDTARQTKRRALADAASRKGRASTVLTNPDDALGGGN